MSSRPAVGLQQPPQQHRAAAAARAPNPSRPTVQANSAASNARKPPPLTVDLTIDVDKPSSIGISPTVQPEGAKPLPSTPTLASPSHRDGPARRSRQPAFAVDLTTVRPSAIERQSAAVIVPFPPRPGQNAPENYDRANGSLGGMADGIRIEGKKQSLEPPAIARQFPQGKCADYQPWQGNHIEDQLSEQTVKSGFQNKPLITNETNTARPSLWSHLKNKQGLSTLSQLFVTVLEKRQTAGRLTAPSTFKPPPRIVFTAPRREQWLQELANSSVVLRRFSKTIPHGIVGKGLLDACLTNNIPVARAVWLAKCVGSNELRSLKRKGNNNTAPIGNEHKWIKEWTINVEHWVDGVLSLYGEKDWSAKIHYAIRLSAALFNEQLLDQDHFLTWILSSLRASSIDRLPFWLLLVQTYWKNIVSSRKRGRRLAESIFDRLKAASEAEHPEILGPVVQRLQRLAMTLAVAHKGCMILPRIWSTYKHLLQSVYSADTNNTLQNAIEDLTRRNDRLNQTNFGAEADGNSLRRDLFKTLDNADFQLPLERIYQDCTDVVGDLPTLGTLVILWSCSIYRCGLHRTYTAARILRRCYSQGIDVDSVLLSFVSDPPSCHGVDFSLVFKLITELVRSGHFSVARFLQSLIATGALSIFQDKSQLLSKTWPTPLLLLHLQPYERLALLAASLPTGDLPEHVATLRDLLLRDATIGMTADAQHMRETIQHIQSQLSSSNCSVEFIDISTDLSLPARSAVSRWMRDLIHAQCMAQGKQPDSASGSAGASHRFLVARELLERTEDFAMLADVVGLTIGTADADCLASVADTLHTHVQCFAAVGALRPLYKALLERYQILRAQELLIKQSIWAVRDLSSSLSVDRSLLQQFTVDLARCSQRDAVAMCSPASDNAADILEIGMDTNDDIERILSSGTTMEEQIMCRVFKRIVARAEKDDVGQRTQVGLWLSRLQSFDSVAFNKLIMEWMTTLLTTARPLALQLLPTLVSCRCLSMSAFSQCAERGKQNNDRAFCSQLDLDVLDAAFPAPLTRQYGSIVNRYRDRLEREKYCSAAAVDVLNRVQRIVLAAGAVCDRILEERLSSVVKRPSFLLFLKHSVVEREQLVASSLGLGSQETPAKCLSIASGIVRALVDPHCQMAEVMPDERIAKLLDTADELSLPFCRLQMQTLVLELGTGNGWKDNVAAKIFKAITAATDKDGRVWPDLIRELDGRVTQQIQFLAESQLFASISPVKQADHPVITCNAVQTLLRIVNCTRRESNPQSFNQVGSVLTEKLRLLLDALGDGNLEQMKDPSSGTPASSSCDVRQSCLWIGALLHLATLHKPSPTTSVKASNDLAAFLSTLGLLLNHPRLQSSFSTIEYIFDVAACFSDDLADEQRATLAKSEFLKPTDPRLAFLFGSSQTPDAWLGLVTSSNLSPAPSNSIPSSSAPTALVSTFTPPRSAQLTRQSSLPQMRPGSLQRSTSAVQPPKSFNPPVPYPLRPWDIIDLGGSQNPNAQQAASGLPANDTAISLTLFGARKVG